MAENPGEQEILVNGHSIVFGNELVRTMKWTPAADGFTLEVVPKSVIRILEEMPSSDFDFLPKESRPAILTPQVTLAKAKRIALWLPV
jgi:hypothetical protein